MQREKGGGGEEGHCRYRISFDRLQLMSEAQAKVAMRHVPEQHNEYSMLKASVSDAWIWLSTSPICHADDAKAAVIHTHDILTGPSATIYRERHLADKHAHYAVCR